MATGPATIWMLLSKALPKTQTQAASQFLGFTFHGNYGLYVLHELVAYSPSSERSESVSNRHTHHVQKV